MAIGLLTTGGTIACAPEENGGALRPVLGPAELLASIPDLPGEDVVARDLARVSGWDVTPATMLEVARTASELLADEQIAGVVITHGTDTIEDTAFVCDLLIASERPVVLTGAMRALSEPRTDAARNLASAFRCAAAPELTGSGAVVVMDYEIHAARWARKADSRHPAALRSPGRGPIGSIEDGRIRMAGDPLERVVFPIPDQLPVVPIVKVYPGVPERAISATLELTGARAIVLEGSGAGNLPASAVPEVRTAIESGVTVAVATWVFAGGTHPTYGGPGGGATLSAMGAVHAGALTARRAQLLLGVLLGLGVAGEGLGRAFANATARLD